MPVFYAQHIDLILCLLSCFLLLSGMTAIGISKEKTLPRPLKSWLYVGIALLILAAREWLGVFGVSQPSFISFFPVAGIMHTAAGICLLFAAHREASPGSFFSHSINIVMGIACIIALGLLMEPYAYYRDYLAEQKSLINVGVFFLSKSAPFLVSIPLLVFTLKHPRKPSKTTIAVLLLICLHCFLIAISHPPGIPSRPGSGDPAFNHFNTTLFLLRLATSIAISLGLWSMYSRAVGVTRQIRWWPVTLLFLFLAFSALLSLASSRNHIRIVRKNLINSITNAAAVIDAKQLRHAAGHPGAANSPELAAEVFGRARDAGFFSGYSPLRYVVDAIALPATKSGRPVPVIDIAANSDGGRWNPADNTLQNQMPELTKQPAMQPDDNERLNPLVFTAPIRDDDGNAAGVAVMSVSGADLARETFVNKRGLLMFIPPAFFMFLLLFSALQRAWLASLSTNRLEAIRLGALGNDLTGVAITSGSVIADCNQRFLDIMKLARDDVIGAPVETSVDVLDPESLSRMNGLINSPDQEEYPSVEVPVRRKDGRIIDLLVFARHLAGGEGEPRHIIWELVDITHQKEMEHQLRNSRDQLQMILDTLPVGVFLKDVHGVYRMVNKTFRDILMLPADMEVVGKSLDEILPEAAEEDWQHDQIALDMKGKPLVYEHPLHIGGRLRHFEISKAVNREGERPDQQSIVGSIHDFTARKEAQNAIIAERHFLMQLINSLPLSMCFIDHDRVIRICDRDFAREAGVDDPASLVGRRYDEIAPYGPVDVQRDIQSSTRHGFNDLEFELYKNDRRRNFIIRRIAMQDADGKILGTLKAFWDTTDLVAANHAAKKADRAKAAFLANMSHELRTPMNGIIGMADLIIEQESTEPLQRLYAETVIKSAKTLQMVMDEVMDVATLDDANRKIRLTVAPFPLLTLSEEAAQIVSCIVEAWGVQLYFSYDFNLHSIYNGDARHLRQIMVQILTHCSRLTADKHLHLAVARAGEESVSFRVSFRQAQDVTADEIEAMFKRSSGAKKSSQFSIGMFDDRIGLPLAWRLIDAMQGSLNITSSGGAIICETVVPLSRDPKGSRQIKTPESLKGTGVVVASNSVDISTAAFSCLSYAGSDILRARNSNETIEKLEKTIAEGHHRPLLLLDSHILPEDELESFLNRVENTPHLAKTDIMLVLDSRQVQNMQNFSGSIKALALPPICPTDIWSKLDVILQTRAAGAGSGDGRRTSSKVIVRRSSDRLTRAVKIPAKVLLVEDNTVNQMVAMGLLKRIGCETALAKNGQEALDKVAGGDEYDLILMDCMMPVMDGYEATARIRRYEKSHADSRRNTIVALTANNVAGDRERCLASGMDGYIPKPITLDILRDSIGRLRPDLVTVVDEVS